MLTSLAFKCTCACVGKCFPYFKGHATCFSGLPLCRCGHARSLGGQFPFSPPFDTVFLCLFIFLIRNLSTQLFFCRQSFSSIASDSSLSWLSVLHPAAYFLLVMNCCFSAGSTQASIIRTHSHAFPDYCFYFICFMLVCF